MSIDFSFYPVSNRTPGVFAEVDPSQANTAQQNQRALIIGQIASGITTTAAKTGGNTGNGTTTLDPTTPQLTGAQLGAYVATFTSSTAYTVKDPSGNTVGTGTTGAAFSNQLKFTIAAGGTPYAVGDAWIITVGQLQSAATPNIPVISAGGGQAVSRYGIGSMLALMVAQYKNNDNFGELWELPLADGAGTAASGTLTFAGTALAAGTLGIYIAGQAIQVPLAVGTAAAAAASAALAAIQAVPGLPVIASVSSGTPAVVNFTARHTGLMGNDIDIRLNYRGAVAGETLPAGLTAAIAAMSGGTVNPSMATALANLTDMPFDFIVLPYTDATSLTAIYGFLSDSSGRWAWNKMVYGHAFAAYRGSYGTVDTFGQGVNNQHVTVMGYYDSPTPSWLWAADMAAAAAASLRADPALPLQTLALNVLAPPVASRFDRGERNTLLYDGISTFTVDHGGTVRIERLITTYQVNPAGAPDTSYLDVETMFTLMAGIRDMRSYLSGLFGRVKLVADGTPIAGGSNMVTSGTVKIAAIGRYNTQCTVFGWMQDPKGFAAAILAQNAGNGLVKLLLPFRLANQLRQIAMLIQFTKP